MSDGDMKKYIKSPLLLDRVYANRLGNGPEESKEGSKYRGLFYDQKTGKNTHLKYGITDNDRRSAPENKNWETCFRFWRTQKFDSLCDDNFSDLSYNEVRRITRKLNGGYNGFNDRMKKADVIETYFKLKGCLND